MNTHIVSLELDESISRELRVEHWIVKTNDVTSLNGEMITKEWLFNHLNMKQALQSLVSENESIEGFMLGSEYYIEIYDIESSRICDIGHVEINNTQKATVFHKRLNFATKGFIPSRAISIKKFHDVNHSETLHLYCANNDIDLKNVSEAEIDGAVLLMEVYGQSDKSCDSYFFWIDEVSRVQQLLDAYLNDEELNHD